MSALIPPGTNDIIPLQEAAGPRDTRAGAPGEATGTWLPLRSGESRRATPG